MDGNHLARTQSEIESAHQSLIDLGVTNHFGEIERHWAAFLIHFERIFHRLEAAARGKGDAWYGRVEQCAGSRQFAFVPNTDMRTVQRSP